MPQARGNADFALLARAFGLSATLSTLTTSFLKIASAIRTLACRMIPPLVAVGFGVFAPDLVGFGRSDKPVENSDYT